MTIPLAWQDLFRSAEHEIGIFADSGASLADDPAILATLHSRAAARGESPDLLT